MLSTIICCEEGKSGKAAARLTEILARTLAALVAAKVEGLLRDVRIAGPTGMGLPYVASHAGCDFAEGASEAEWLHCALRAAQGPLILLIRCGFAPQQGFIEETSEFLASPAKTVSRGALLRALPQSFLERLFPRLTPVAALIAPRDVLLRAPQKSFGRLAGYAASGRTFDTRARELTSLVFVA